VTPGPAPAGATRAQLQVWATAWIRGWLAEDYWTISRIGASLDSSGATARQVAEAFSLVGAGLLARACGDLPAATAAADARLSAEVAAAADLLLADDPA
jgi:hypothetical protein